VKQYSGLYAMPAKSAAYEQGIREGRAMAARARNMESPEEEEEEEEEEMDMAASHSRKRSAKGAKHTKPAADGYGKKPMDAECGCKGKKGAKCDGNCGSMRKRGDSLTPLEYLDACELGIQDRSPTYIRARLDTAERLDLKCGKGAISEGEKCTKGTAQEVIKKAAPIALGLGLAAGAIALRRRGRKPRVGDGRTVPNIPKTPPRPGRVSSPASRAQAEAMATRVTERVKQRVRENPQKIGYEMQAEEIKNAAMRDVVQSKKFQDAFKRRTMTMEELAELARDPDAFDKWLKRTDSALTSSTIRSDLKCGRGSISEGEKCTKGSAQRVQPQQRGGSKVRGLKTAAKIAGAAALIGGAAYMQQTAKRNTDLRRALDPAARAKAGAQAPSKKTQLVAVMKAREAAWKKAKRPSVRDAWADGFSADSGSFDI